MKEFKALSRNQEKALLALLANAKIRDAARDCGLSEPTLWRYLQDESFQKRYRLSRRQTVESALGQLQAASDEAVETLKRNLNCGEAGPENTAAKTILDLAIRGVELVDLQEQVEELKRTVERYMQDSGKVKKWGR